MQDKSERIQGPDGTDRSVGSADPSRTSRRRENRPDDRRTRFWRGTPSRASMVLAEASNHTDRANETIDGMQRASASYATAVAAASRVVAPHRRVSHA